MSRYYNPEIARFISEDIYRGELNDPLSLNRYVYVNNNPMIYRDPDGQAPVPLITGIIGGIFGSGSTFVQDLLDDGKINTNWKTYVGNTVQGAITGAMLGAPGANVLLAGFGGGFAGNVANQLITTGGSKVSLEQSAISGLTTAVTAGAFSATGQVTSTGFDYVKDYAIRGAFAGVTGDVTYQYLNNGITRDNDNKVTGYSIGQAINNYNLNQTLRSGGIGAVMAPVGAKIVETAINKWGPYRNFDLQNPESFKGAKLKTVEKYLDKSLIGKKLNSDNIYKKESLAKGVGTRYTDGKGGSFRLNYGYDKPIVNGADGLHTRPYLTTTVGSTVVKIPLK